MKRDGLRQTTTEREGVLSVAMDRKGLEVSGEAEFLRPAGCTFLVQAGAPSGRTQYLQAI
jgi:hypothetical protein